MHNQNRTRTTTVQPAETLTVRLWLRHLIALGLWMMVSAFAMLTVGVPGLVGGWAWSALIFAAPIPLLLRGVPSQRRLETTVVCLTVAVAAGFGIYQAAPPGVPRLRAALSRVGAPANGSKTYEQVKHGGCLPTCPALLTVYTVPDNDTDAYTLYASQLADAGFTATTVAGRPTIWSSGRDHVQVNSLPAWAHLPTSPAPPHTALFAVLVYAS